MLLINGKIYTNKGFEEAVLLKDDLIICTGKSKELLKNYPQEEVLNLKGRLVLPGFNDSHLHLLSFARFQEFLNISKAKSNLEIIQKGRAARKENKILTLSNYDDNNIDSPFLVRQLLDQISEEIPIIVYRSCGHIAIVNTKALSMLPSIKNEKGILKEDELSLLENLYPETNALELEENIKTAIAYGNSLGITSISSNDLKADIEKGKRIIAAYQSLERKGALKARVNLQYTFLEVDKIAQFKKSLKASPFLRLGPLKLFLDGSLGGRTALLSRPYLDNSFGIQTLETEKLEELVDYAANNALQVAIHAIGDQAINICLDVFAKYCKDNALRHFLIHLQVLRADLLEKLSKQKVLASVQPIFIEEDLKMAKRVLPAELLKTSYAFKSLNQATVMAFSSDAPYGGLNPLAGIQAALTQSNLEKESLNLEERLTLKEALDAYTEKPAFLSFEEKRKGKIAAGYYADLVVLSKDLFSLDVFDIRKSEVEMTIVGGKIVYQKEL